MYFFGYSSQYPSISTANVEFLVDYLFYLNYTVNWCNENFKYRLVVSDQCLENNSVRLILWLI